MTGGATVPATVPAVLDEAVRRFGDRQAIVDGPTRMTYAELGEQVDAAGRALLADGIEPGDRVAVWSPNTYHWVVAALALHSAGAALVPVNTRLVGAEAIDLLRRSKTRALFVPDRFLGHDYLGMLRAASAEEGAEEGESGGGPVPGLPELKRVVRIPVDGAEPSDVPGVVGWADWLPAGEAVPAGRLRERAAAVDPDAVCDILFTSGTTGRAKGVMSSHRQTVDVADAWAEHARVDDSDRYMIISPFFHSFGYKAGYLVCLLRGATIAPQAVFDVERTLEIIAAERISILPGPPTIYESLLAHAGRSKYDTSSLRLAVTGTAIVPVALIERMREHLTFRSIMTAYGLTEAVVVTMCHPDDDPETISRTCGVAAAGFELRIVDPDAPGGEISLRPPGEDGEVQVRGRNVMLGYLDDPAATRAAMAPGGWFRTGDIGHLDERGYLTITDRLKDMFTVGGFNVYPAEIEQVLMRLRKVTACSVVGAPDLRLGEVPWAYVIGDGLGEDEVIAYCRRYLANFKVPRKVQFVDELPRNAAGKVLKWRLREMAREAP